MRREVGALAHCVEHSFTPHVRSGSQRAHSQDERKAFTLQYVAARAGVGLALLPLPIALRGIQEGSLVRVTKDWSTPELDIHLV
jgi:DNA-binding transcriptional LysR family regulator